MLIPQELAVNFALIFDPVAQLFVFHAFHVLSSSMSMLDINEILDLLLRNFFMMVLFLWRCLFFAIFWSLWIYNIASVFLFWFIISYLLLYIYSVVAILCDVIKFEFNLFLWWEYLKILVYYLISIVLLYQTITLTFLHCTVMFFNKTCVFIIYHFVFL